MFVQSPRTREGCLLTMPCVFHSTDWAPEILAEDRILGNSTIDPKAQPTKTSDLRFDHTHHGLRGICVTRSFYFARQFSDAIFALDRRAIRYHHRIILRAERDAYDLANEHGDFRIEAEEFIVCEELPLSAYLLAIWVREDHIEDPEYRHIASHDRFAGYFRHL